MLRWRITKDGYDPIEIAPDHPAFQAHLVPKGSTIPGMVYVPAGSFALESDHVDIALPAYWMDQYEVTNENYARFAEATGRRKPFHWIGGKIPPGQEKFPVYNVTWDDAVAYCTFLGKRLPTVAEWERAARGGVEKTMFPWGNELEAQGRRQAGGGEQSESRQEPAKRARYGYPNGAVPVGSYAPNGFGLYDVVGNVWEWVSDWYEQYYYSVSPEKNPQGPDTGLYRVIRGGGWSGSGRAAP